jgi:hypothetical protein
MAAPSRGGHFMTDTKQHIVESTGRRTFDFGGFGDLEGQWIRKM